MQLGGHFMHPYMFASGVDIRCGVVDTGFDDLSAIPTKGLFIVSDTPSLRKSSLAFRAACFDLARDFKIKESSC